jgi:beta-glucosidase
VQVGGFDKDIGYRVFVDDKLLLDQWSLRKTEIAAVALTLDARPHKIVLEHRAVAGGLDGRVPFVRMGVVRSGNWVEANAEPFAAQADAAIVVVGFDYAGEAEASDRSFQLPPGQEELIRKVCAVNPRCIVVITSGGAVDMNRWLDKVPALLQGWYLGQEGGAALAQVISGSVNPSGHLPATFEKRWEDNPTHDSYYPAPGGNQVNYKEGVFVGYRGYEATHTAPLFPFGFGLSYTQFKFADLQIRKTPEGSASYEAEFRITNSGARAGAVVPQLYVAPPRSAVPRPLKELKGFAKLSLQPGESRQVIMPLDLRSFAYYDVKGKQWRADAGEYQVLIGESSAQIDLHGALKLTRALTAEVR